MAEWEIDKTFGRCSGTGEEFAVGQEYYSALVQTDEGFQRRDYSVAFWDERKPKVFCYWKTKMPDPQDKRKIFIDVEMLLAFFERLAEETETERVNFRFVLTLILMQKRKLKYESSEIEGGDEVWTVRVAGEGRRVKVVNPHLTEEAIEELTGQMGQIMRVDL